MILYRDIILHSVRIANVRKLKPSIVNMNTRNLLSFLFIFFCLHTSIAQSYTPSPGNLATRKQFQNDKFGMFIHWGASSVLGAGEWVMHEKRIKANDYKKLQHIFNPEQF